MPKRIQMSRQRPWRAENPDAVIVDRRTKWGNPFRLGEAQVRMPALDGREWEFEGRLFKTTGEKAMYMHEGGRVTWHQIELATPEQISQMFRASITGHRWPIDWKASDRTEKIRRELGGRDLACWCPLDFEWCHADVYLDVANPERTAA